MYYIYKITFEETPHFYLGVRKHPDPSLDPHFGSPSSNKSYWTIYTPKKQIFCTGLDRERALQLEREIIRQNWSIRYCLNRSCGGTYSKEALRDGGIKSQRIMKERYDSDPSLKEKVSESGRNNLVNFHNRRKLDTDLDERFRSSASQVAKKNSQMFLEKRKSDPEFDALYRSWCGKSSLGKSWFTNGTRNIKLPKGSEAPKGFWPGKTNWRSK